MDITVRWVSEESWSLTDLLNRSMGRVVLVEDKGFMIVPEGHAVETMTGMAVGPHPTLDAALATIERHTRGTCRRHGIADETG